MDAYPCEENNLYLAFAIVCESLVIDMFGRNSKAGRGVGNIKAEGGEKEGRGGRMEGQIDEWAVEWRDRGRDLKGDLIRSFKCALPL